MNHTNHSRPDPRPKPRHSQQCSPQNQNAAMPTHSSNPNPLSSLYCNSTPHILFQKQHDSFPQHRAAPTAPHPPTALPPGPGRANCVREALNNLQDVQLPGSAVPAPPGGGKGPAAPAALNTRTPTASFSRLYNFFSAGAWRLDFGGKGAFYACMFV